MSALLLAVTVSWSVFHPVWPDLDEFRKVVEKADAYGGVDSFEACGRCSDPRGGLNGLLLYEPYPTAAAEVDAEWVLKNRRLMNEIVDLSHRSGRPFYYWHREIFMPRGVLRDVPELKDADGEFDLLGAAYRDYLRWKIGAAFTAVPKLDGIVLTLTEADFSVLHNSDTRRYPPVKVVEHLVRIFAEEHAARGKKLIVRSFGSIASDYEAILAGTARVARDYPLEIETKITPYDFDPYLPDNPFLRKTPGAELGAECDGMGEFFGAGYFPAAQVPVIRRYVSNGRAAGVDRYTIRIDRVGNSIFDSAHEINIYAYMRFIRDPKATPEQVLTEWAARRWKGYEAEMIKLAAQGFEATAHNQFIDQSVVFHQNPPVPNLKYVKSCGICSIFRDGFGLQQTDQLWGMLSERQTPGRQAILAEKDQAVRLAEEGLARLTALRGRLAPDEYARQRRAWTNIAVVSKATREFVRCLCAYFDDMDASAAGAPRLTSAVTSAETTINALMKCPNRRIDGYADHCSAMGEDLDVVYLYPLRWLCRELLREYHAEFKARGLFAGRDDVLDFVIPGGIYDDVRVWRSAMHASYQDVESGVPVRHVGNEIFPNGLIRVEFEDVPQAVVEVCLDPRGAQDYSLREESCGGRRRIWIGKKGAAYPAVRSIALVKGSAACRPDFTCGKSNSEGVVK